MVLLQSHVHDFCRGATCRLSEDCWCDEEIGSISRRASSGPLGAARAARRFGQLRGLDQHPRVGWRCLSRVSGPIRCDHRYVHSIGQTLQDGPALVVVMVGVAAELVVLVEWAVAVESGYVHVRHRLSVDHQQVDHDSGCCCHHHHDFDLPDAQPCSPRLCQAPLDLLRSYHQA